ncbi:MAG: hypothetical protein HGJ94_00555 [Desulfosarcina sp.]|nr:hypothetical protein [Desulfosarcina sp.]MBC2742821.1 hypothetical protein [Desulfosarcina sp.]MBC2765731.1 hypothetical protein [Desulfosarcina sp.]
MVLKQNGNHALIGLWILAGLLVAGLNGYTLMALLDAPLSGYSDGVRAADRGMQQCQTLLVAETEKIILGMDLLAYRFTPVTAVEDEPPAAQNAAVPPVKKRVSTPSVVLPSLTGIITSRSTNGAVSRLALLDGTVFSEGGTLRYFTVKGISVRGVLLARGGQTWFLKAPEITFSLTTR